MYDISAVKTIDIKNLVMTERQQEEMSRLIAHFNTLPEEKILILPKCEVEECGENQYRFKFKKNLGIGLIVKTSESLTSMDVIRCWDAFNSDIFMISIEPTEDVSESISMADSDGYEDGVYYCRF